MTVVRPNSISGITSITAQTDTINFFKSDGTLQGLLLNGTNFNTTSGVSTFNALNVGVGGTVITATAPGLVGIGTNNPIYALTVTNSQTPALSGLTNCVIDATSTTNSYSQINVRNSNNGANASGDYVITANNGTDSTNFVDLGLNSSGFTTSTWTINGANDGYLYASDGNFSVGVAGSKFLSFFTGGTLAANERLRIDSSGRVGIGSTIPTSILTVTGDARVSGVVTATSFVGSGANLTGLPAGFSELDTMLFG